MTDVLTVRDHSLPCEHEGTYCPCGWIGAPNYIGNYGSVSQDYRNHLEADDDDRT
jgi:hypothetical protein